MGERPGENGEPAGGRSPWVHAGLGFELAATVVLLMYAGRRLDQWLGFERPWLMVFGAVLGVATGLYGLFRRLLSPPRGGEGR